MLPLSFLRLDLTSDVMHRFPTTSVLLSRAGFHRPARPSSGSSCRFGMQYNGQTLRDVPLPPPSGRREVPGFPRPPLPFLRA